MNSASKPILIVGLTLLLAACQTTDTGQNTTAQQETEGSSAAYSVKRPAAIAQPRQPVKDDDTAAPEVVYATVWERIAAGLTLYQAYDHESIDSEVRWYAENPQFFQQVASRAAPFLFSIVEEVERRELPMELALLPVVESGFNATAYSSQRAAGLWQFMGSTASNFGLQRDWWYDGRLDPLQSTVAALDYLQALHAQFDNDWLLAVAAYNAGEGNMRRALSRLKSAKPEPLFWQLRLPGETRSHVPRLLAVARIFANPQAYGIELPPVGNEPYLAVVDPGFQLDLASAATAAGLELNELRALNPGYRQWATHPEGPHTLVVPASRLLQFNQQVASLPPAQRMVWDNYQIQPGDTLSTIASRFGLTADVLMQANGLQSSRIIAGRSLLIPQHDISDPSSIQAVVSANQPLTTPAPATYRVRAGDNLWRIARRHDLRSVDIAAWNGIKVDAVLRPGQVLILQPNEIIASTEFEDGGQQRLVYRIKAGDTLGLIARRHQVSIEDLVNWNGVSLDGLIHPGQEVVIYVPSRDVN
jgi:membrane-bound lytic murein transglycosylase D